MLNCSGGSISTSELLRNALSGVFFIGGSEEIDRLGQTLCVLQVFVFLTVVVLEGLSYLVVLIPCH